MKIKLIIPLLAVCLALSVVSVQAQTELFGDMDDINVIVGGNITETITCNLTGSAVIVEKMDNATGNMTNATGNMTGATGNMTNATDNMTNATAGNMTDAAGNMTLDVTGKIILIKDLGNMTEKAVIVGRMDNIPGNVVIFGQVENVTENMTNMTEDLGDVAENMKIFTTGNVTGEIMLKTTEGMDNMTGGVENMAAGMDNFTVVMAGNMTGNITGDMTKRVVVAKNLGDVTEACMAAENVCDFAEMEANMTDNMTDSMMCNITGKAVIIRSMDNMSETAEEDMSDLALMDGNTAVIGDVQDMTETDEEVDDGMSSITGKMVIVENLDDSIRIMTRTITCGFNQSTTAIEGMEDITAGMDNMTEEMDNVTEEMDNVTEEMDNVTEEMDNVTEEMDNVTTGNVTDNMTGNLTGETVEVSIEDFNFEPESVTISTGDTVRWTNMDSADHTVTGSAFDSGTLEEGDSYEFTFTEVGTFEYYCSIHPEMEGTVSVTDGNGNMNG